MRVLLIFLLFPVSLFAGNPMPIDLSYSIKGENIIITWTTQMGVDQYEVYAGTQMNPKGEVDYRLLHALNNDGKFQLEFIDSKPKKAVLHYYKVVGRTEDGKVISEKTFTANFITKEVYTVNVNPNFFNDVLEFELNAHKSGTVKILIEDIINDFKKSEEIPVKEGYNTFALDLENHESDRYVVKVEFAGKTTYRLVDMRNTNEKIITSDE